MIIERSILEPIRSDQSWDDRWTGPDKGLISCWEVGRLKRVDNQDLVKKCEAGQLLVLGWVGGVAENLKMKEKRGSLFYLAQWQGIRGEDLYIDRAIGASVICTSSGVKVTFTKA